MQANDEDHEMSSDSQCVNEKFQKLQLEFTESTQTEDFKLKVCLPYFRDIFKDLCSRSDDKNKGINRISFCDYC